MPRPLPPLLPGGVVVTDAEGNKTSKNTIVGASVADPYVVVWLVDGTLRLLEADAEDDELVVSRPVLPATAAEEKKGMIEGGELSPRCVQGASERSTSPPPIHAGESEGGGKKEGGGPERREERERERERDVLCCRARMH